MRHARAHLFLLGLLGLCLFLPHLFLLSLPFYWDELGQYVPASLDLFQHGWWIPRSTLPNVHPPGLMTYLAGVWSVTGYSILATRAAMLVLGTMTAWLAFLLAVRLGRGTQGWPAFSAVLFLCSSPLFFTQSMMAQLELPAALFTLLALLLFLDGRWRWAALACVGLVLVKETGLVVPAAFGAWLCYERKPRAALWFVLPLGVLGAWLLVLYQSTGHLLGNAEFARYNAFFSLHPVRAAAALLRRLYYLLFAEFHWIGALALWFAWRRTRLFSSREWRIIALVAGAHILVVSLFGGAVLERYLLPVLPLLYVAVAVACTTLPGRAKLLVPVALCAGLVIANFWNPPYPFPFENNLAMVDFVHLQQAAAEYVDHLPPDLPVSTAWPLTDALRRPEFGYVQRPHPVQALEDFRPSEVARADSPYLVLYCRTWDPEHGLLRLSWVEEFLRRYYDYEPPVTGEFADGLLGYIPLVRSPLRGQWAEIFRRQNATGQKAAKQAAF